MANNLSSKKVIMLNAYLSPDLYPELKEFKDLTDGDINSPHKQFYTQKKARVLRYRIIFYFFALFFLLVAGFIYLKSAVWLVSSIKPIICLFSLALSVCSFTLGFSLSVEREAVRDLYHHALDCLNRIYLRQKGEIDKKTDLDLIESFKRKFALNSPFKAMKSKMKEEELECLKLMDRISMSPTQDEETKEKLRNQALLQLQDTYYRHLQQI